MRTLIDQELNQHYARVKPTSEIGATTARDWRVHAIIEAELRQRAQYDARGQGDRPYLSGAL